MSNRNIALLLLFITQTALGQQLKEEAVYYDNNQAPYKIERKYTDSNLIKYITHDNQGSVCVQRETSFSGDTTIIKETSYLIFNKRTKHEEFQDCNIWGVSRNLSGDTVLLSGSTDDISVGDTLLTGEAARNSWDFSERIKKERVPFILSGKIIVNTDSLICKEIVFSYFINGIPVKVEVYDAENSKNNTITSEMLKNKIIYKRYFTKDELKLYQTDTVSWNEDTTTIRWSSTFKEQKQTNVSEFQINGTNLQVAFNNITKREIEFLDNKNIFKNRLIGNLIYSDVLYYMELRYFDREKIVSVTTNGQTSNNKFTFDNKNRIIEQLSYDKGQLQKRVTYKHED
jgi:hypothetical protein